MAKHYGLKGWERRAFKGDFSQMPRPFLWEQSARFAHFLNGYEEAGGFQELADLAIPISESAVETGRWRGSARELWLCLFFAHRTARHTGSNPHVELADHLCEDLRSALQALDNNEALSLAARMKLE